jgi:hypothetical protein
MRGHVGSSPGRRPSVSPLRPTGLYTTASASQLLGNVLAGILVVLVAVAALAGAGSRPDMLFPLGACLVAALLAASVAALRGWIPWPSLGFCGSAAVLLLVALALWCAASISWSVAPDRSWAYVNRALVYLGYLALGLFVGAALRRAPSVVARAFALVIAIVVAWALASKIAPALAEDGPIARLRTPIGYWNALALAFATGMPLALFVASESSSRRWVRAAAAALLTGLIVGLVLTYSRGGIIVTAVAVAVWFAFAARWVDGLAILAVSLVFAAAAFAFALTRAGVTADAEPYDLRVSDGRLFGVVLTLALAGAFVTVYAALRLGVPAALARRLRGVTPRHVKTVALALVAAACIAAVATGWLPRGIRDFANPPTELVTQESARLTSLSSNNRWSWWNEAWVAFRTAPVTGTGASSFPIVHRLLRDDALTVTTPHSGPLQLLAETGVVGALLGVAAAALALVALVGAVRRRSGTERAAAAALFAGIVAYLVHAAIDFPQDFVAVSAPAFGAAGVLLARPPRGATRRISIAWLPALVLLATAATVSLAAPWLSARRVSETYDLIAAGRPEQALSAAESAQALNPLALDASFATARAHVALGEIDSARAVLLEAVDTHPLNSEVWAELGALESTVPGHEATAARYLERARQLDPLGGL